MSTEIIDSVLTPDLLASQPRMRDRNGQELMICDEVCILSSLSGTDHLGHGTIAEMLPGRSGKPDRVRVRDDDWESVTVNASDVEIQR